MNKETKIDFWATPYGAILGVIIFLTAISFLGFYISAIVNLVTYENQEKLYGDCEQRITLKYEYGDFSFYIEEQNKSKIIYGKPENNKDCTFIYLNFNASQNGVDSLK